MRLEAPEAGFAPTRGPGSVPPSVGYLLNRDTGWLTRFAWFMRPTNQTLVGLSLCRFPGDTCHQSRSWWVPGPLPTVFRVLSEMTPHGETDSVLDADGSVQHGCECDAESQPSCLSHCNVSSPITWQSSTVQETMANYDISVQSGSSVTLTQLTLSRQFPRSKTDDVPAPVHVGGTKQLFVDTLLLDTIAPNAGSSPAITCHAPGSGSDCAEHLHMHQPARARGATNAPLINPDAPWEVALGNPRLNAYNSVLWDEDRGLFRVWYELMAPLPLPDLYSYIGYAEVSADLQEVTKPLLHQLEVNGSTANNFLAGLSVNSSSSGAKFSREGVSVWKDPFRTLGGEFVSQANGPHGLVFSTSPDGVSNWTDVDATCPGATDSQTVVFWDEPRLCYSLYTRWRNETGWHPGSKTDPARGVRRLNSPDGAGKGALTEWVDEAVVLYPDSVDDSSHRVWPLADVVGERPLGYYGALVMVYEGLYLMFPQRFWHWAEYMYPSGKPSVGEQAPVMMDIGLATSRDGKIATSDAFPICVLSVSLTPKASLLQESPSNTREAARRLWGRARSARGLRARSGCFRSRPFIRRPVTSSCGTGART